MHAVYICTQCMPVVHTSATNPDGSLLRGNMNTMWLATHITATKLHYIARLTWPTCSHQTIYWCIPPCRPWCGVQQHIKCMGPKHPLHTHTHKHCSTSSEMKDGEEAKRVMRLFGCLQLVFAATRKSKAIKSFREPYFITIYTRRPEQFHQCMDTHTLQVWNH